MKTRQRRSKIPFSRKMVFLYFNRVHSLRPVRLTSTLTWHRKALWFQPGADESWTLHFNDIVSTKAEKRLSALCIILMERQVRSTVWVQKRLGWQGQVHIGIISLQVHGIRLSWHGSLELVVTRISLKTPDWTAGKKLITELSCLLRFVKGKNARKTMCNFVANLLQWLAFANMSVA